MKTALQPAFELKDAQRLCDQLGVELTVVELDLLALPEIRENGSERCYYCKKIRFTSLVNLAKSEGYQWVIDGGNVDDLGDYRPGMKALEELSDSVRSPMIEAGLNKADIRALSKEVRSSRPGISRVPLVLPAAFLTASA